MVFIVFVFGLFYRTDSSEMRRMQALL